MGRTPDADFPDFLNPPPIEIPQDRDVTWVDVMEAGRNGDMLLYQMMRMIQAERMPREQVIIRTLLAQAEANRRLRRDLIDYINRSPGRPILVVPGCDQL